MADQKLTALTASTQYVAADLLYLVRDVAGTPVSRKIVASDLFGPWDSDTLGGTAASIDFSSIPATARNIRIIYLLRTDRAGQVTDGVNIAFNGDTTATNYEWQRLQTQTTTVTGLYTNDARNITRVPGATATSNHFGVGEIIIPFYAQTSTNKVAQCSFGSPDTAGSLMVNGLYSTVWQSTAAINQITLTPVNGPNFIAGCQVAVYLEF